MSQAGRTVSLCCLAIIMALYVVGAVSHGSLRHVVQTLPLWIPFVAGLHGREYARWMTMPCFVFWLGIMVLIWLFLLNIAHIVSGHFSPTEIAMTIVVGVASILGFGTAIRWRTGGRLAVATGYMAVSSILQLVCFRLSLLPGIANR